MITDPPTTYTLLSLELDPSSITRPNSIHPHTKPNVHEYNSGITHDHLPTFVHYILLLQAVYTTGLLYYNGLYFQWIVLTAIAAETILHPQDLVFHWFLPGSITILTFHPMCCSSTLLNNLYFSAKEREIYKLANTNTIFSLWKSKCVNYAMR